MNRWRRVVPFRPLRPRRPHLGPADYRDLFTPAPDALPSVVEGESGPPVGDASVVVEPDLTPVVVPPRREAPG